MTVVARIDGVDYPVRSVSSGIKEVFTNFADTVPSELVSKIGDGQTHEVRVVVDDVEREKWITFGSGHHTDYTDIDIAAYIVWSVISHEVL